MQENRDRQSNISYYAGIFLIGFTTLTIEVTFSRLLSVITHYHLAFFAVSTAMLGMTAGAITIYLLPDWIDNENFRRPLAKASLAFAVSIPISVFTICLTPLTGDLTLMRVLGLFVITVACSLPFYFSGIVITGLLTRTPLPVNKLYASDLTGAAFGCLFVLFGITIFDGPSLIIFSGILALIAGFLFGGRSFLLRHWIKGTLLLLFLLLFSFLNFFSHRGIRPVVVKGQIEDVENILYEKWNSYSRVVVLAETCQRPQLSGPSPLAPVDDSIHQYKMIIDGEASTVLRKFGSLGDIGHLRYDIVNAAYFLRPGGNACIIGVGGGKDIQSAILFGSKKVTGIDINPIFIHLLKTKFRAFAGIAGHKGVSLISDEARSYLSRTKDSFDILQMSLIDTWASTGAGAFSLSENGLYTTEAWKVFLGRLSSHGLFTVSRWYDPRNLGETGRILSLAVSSLLEAGITEPSKHIALLTIRNVSTLIISRSAFSPDDLTALDSLSSVYKYQLAITPGSLPGNETLRKMVLATSKAGLERAIKCQALNYAAPTDEDPYFFNMLKLSQIFATGQHGHGVVQGNLTATVTLLVLIGCLSVLTLLTIVIPLLTKRAPAALSRPVARSPV
ncbi:MAG TPA: hypothetical protein VE035_13325, partial [Puia sp.]|nr:hypothetical protein [Puia sp.]